MKIKLFAKEKPGLNEAIEFLRTLSNDIELYIGQVGDPFPEEAKNHECDLLISYISPWIIPEEVLMTAKLYSINFHPGPPEYPGIGCTNFALYEGVDTFGVTCHIMKKKVDSGKIISIKRFPIYVNDTVETLTNRCYNHISIQFYEVISEISSGKKIKFLNESWKRKPFTRKQLNDLCKLNINMTEQEVKKRIRALVYPNMPGPFIELFGFKFKYEE